MFIGFKEVVNTIWLEEVAQCQPLLIRHFIILYNKLNCVNQFIYTYV